MPNSALIGAHGAFGTSKVAFEKPATIDCHKNLLTPKAPESFGARSVARLQLAISKETTRWVAVKNGL
jgi:hypothetical protein